jgi:hypothetical protein
MRDVRILPSRHQWPRPILNLDGVVLRVTCWRLRNITRAASTRERRISS